MIKSFGQAVRDLYRRPALFLPALIAVLVQLLLLYALYDYFFEFMYEVLVLGLIPEGPILSIPFLLLVSYPVGITAAAVLVLAAFCANAWAVFAIADYVGGSEKKGKITASLSFAVKSLPRILALAVFAIAVSIVFSALLLLVVWLGIVVPLLSLLSLLGIIVAGVLGAYIFVKLYFLPIIMAVEKQNVKKAVQAAWGWSKGRFWELVAVVFVLTVLGSALGSAGASLGELTGDDLYTAGAAILFMAIAVAYSAAMATRYYAKQRSGN